MNPFRTMIFMAILFVGANGCSRSEGQVASEYEEGAQDARIAWVDPHAGRDSTWRLGWHALDSAMHVRASHVLEVEAVIEIAEHRLALDGQRIGDLEWNPKWGFWDFPESLWTGFAIKPLVEALERRGPHQGVKVKIRLPGETPYAVLDPLLHSLARTGFKSVILLAEDGTEHRAVLEDPVLLYDPPPSLAVYAGYMEAEMREDSLIVCRLPFDCDDRFVPYDPVQQRKAIAETLRDLAGIPAFGPTKRLKPDEVRVAFSRSGSHRDPLSLSEEIGQKLTDPVRLKTLVLWPWGSVAFRDIIGMCRLVAAKSGDSATVVIRYWI